jgi:hypothetical protein
VDVRRETDELHDKPCHQRALSARGILTAARGLAMPTGLIARLLLGRFTCHVLLVRTRAHGNEGPGPWLQCGATPEPPS